MVATENAKCMNGEGYMDHKVCGDGNVLLWWVQFSQWYRNKGISWHSKEKKVGIESLRKEEKIQMEVDCNDLEAPFEVDGN